jgi:dienelactone hydrolase
VSDTTAVSEVHLEASDGWPIGAILRMPPIGARPAPAIVTVPGSLHARDAWTQAASALVSAGLAVLQIDIRGRGTSTNGTPYPSMGPAQRRRVGLDVAAAVEHVAGLDGVDARRLALLLEQDTAATALEAVADAARVRAIAVLSARHGDRVARAVSRHRTPVYGLVSIEDRDGLRATVDGYLAAPPEASRLDVFRGLGVGITMASVMQFERPGEQQIEARLAEWFTGVLGVD